jgi:EmrB/QacA subfamily drug resistance transporter
VLPLTLTLLSEAFPAGRRGLVLGLWSGLSGLAVALGPLIGGAVVDGISWHWIFWINVPIGIVLVPLAIRFLTESHGPAKHLDMPGLALGGLGLLGVVYGIVRGNEVGWASAEILGSLIAGAALVAAFVAWELRAPHPMLPMRFFRSRTFSAANGVGFIMFFGVFGSIFLLAQFLQVTQGLSPLEAGIRTLPWTAMPIVVAPVAGLLSDRIGSRPLMALGLALQAGALAWLAAVSTPDVPYSELVLPFIMAGSGMALVFAPQANAVLGAVTQAESGQASGATNAIRELGGVMGVAVLASVFSAHGSYASPQAFSDGMVSAVWVGAAVLAAGALIALLIPRAAGRAADRAEAAAPAPQVAPEPVAA